MCVGTLTNIIFAAMKKITGLLVLAITILTSCSEFTRVLKSNDVDYKYKKAKEYYADEAYGKSIPVLEDLIPTVRGTNISEDVFYLYAMSYYKSKDFYLAGFYFKNFVKTFPKSVHSEECSFLKAYCSYRMSPKYSLDQSETTAALDNIQLFLEAYPKTSLRDSCNSLVQYLEAKLERKQYEHARLYFKTEKYKSAVVSLQNTLKEFPVSVYEEDIRMMILKASYELAFNSVTSKKVERFEDTIKAYQNYIDKFADSKRANEAENIFKASQKQLESLKS